LFPPRIRLETAVALIAGLGVLIVLTTKWAVVRSAGEAYDLHPVSRYLYHLQKDGVAVAHEGKYHGQYQFLGRLTDSPEVVDRDNIKAWFDEHPEGRVITYFKVIPRQIKIDFTQKFYGRFVGILDREAWRAVNSDATN
jgi:hypothetical protein